MKFSCYKSDLSNALNFVSRAVAPKPMTPILSGIYLKASGEILELQANNLSTGIVTKIPASVEVEGEIAVSGKRFVEFVKNMPDDTISAAIEDNMLRLNSGGANVELLTMKPIDFPKVKIPDVSNTFTLHSYTLYELIKRTSFAIGKDDSRPIFTGGYFEISGNDITLVATNTRRLAIAKANFENSAGDSKFIVPATALQGLLQRIDPKDTNQFIKVSYTNRSVIFTFDNVLVTSRILEGAFPPCDNIIPKECATRAVVDTAEFKHVVDFIALMAKDNEYNTTHFNFAGDGSIEVSANSVEIGGAVQAVEAEIEGAEVSIAFNVSYIADALKVINSPKIIIELNDKYSPAKITEPDNPNFVYVVTPVRA